jgi:hypothetical protein
MSTESISPKPHREKRKIERDGEEVYTVVRHSQRVWKNLLNRTACIRGAEEER